MPTPMLVTTVAKTPHVVNLVLQRIYNIYKKPTLVQNRKKVNAMFIGKLVMLERIVFYFYNIIRAKRVSN